MHKTEAARIVGMILGYYPKTDLKPTVLDLWTDRIATIDRDFTWASSRLTSFLECREQSGFIPSLAEVMQELKGAVHRENMMRVPNLPQYAKPTPEENARAAAFFAEMRARFGGDDAQS